MLLKILQLDTNNELIAFPEGTHFIGRGDSLQCNDKRVSRSHAKIQVTSTEVALISNHMNPCFLKASESTNVSVLSQGNSKLLHNGDKFGFLPEAYWFKVKIDVINQPNSGMTGTKRPFDESVAEESEKRLKPDESLEPTLFSLESSGEETATAIKLEIDEEIAETDLVVENVPEPEEPCDTGNPAPEVSDIQEEVKTEPTEVKEESGEVKEEPTEVQEEPTEVEPPPCSSDNNADEPDKNNPGTSNPGAKKQRRERCWYGATCYRKNPVHRTDFSHPGDTDFDSDASDDRPLCPFGAACYRRNRDHRREYKHLPGRPAPKNKRKKRKAAAARRSASDYDDEEEEEDPFIDDGSSDEYVEESDSSDSDWNDSREYKEESEELRSLKKEAKKFVNKK